MSALSFLSKKSWHTGLQQNQEAVWKAEKSALEERRKLDELRKERDREREIQELERLQEEAGGKKKRVDKVDWMYNAPASGSNVDKGELEDYLLGKKRVDKLLKGEEGLQHSRGNQEGPISEQKAVGSDRDVAAKIREDPMFAIRQQEQAAYQALLKDPARLRAMKKAAGMDLETKEERRRRKEEKKRKRRGEGGGGDDGGDRRLSPYRERNSSSRRGPAFDDERRHDSYDDRRRHEDRYAPGSSTSERRRRDDDYHQRRSDVRRDERPHDGRHAIAQRRSTDDYARHSDPQRRPRPRSRSPPPRQGSSETDRQAEREAKLAAMQANATSLSSSRTEYLAKVKADEEASAAREDELRTQLQRSKERGYGDGKSSFLVQQQRDLYGAGGMDLNERLKRSRDGLQRMGAD